MVSSLSFQSDIFIDIIMENGKFGLYTGWFAELSSRCRVVDKNVATRPTLHIGNLKSDTWFSSSLCPITIYIQHSGDAFQKVVFTSELHQRCGVGDDDRRKSDRTERIASPAT